MARISPIFIVICLIDLKCFKTPGFGFKLFFFLFLSAEPSSSQTRCGQSEEEYLKQSQTWPLKKKIKHIFKILLFYFCLQQRPQLTAVGDRVPHDEALQH